MFKAQLIIISMWATLVQTPVSVIDSSTNSVAAVISVGDNLFAIEFNPANNNIYVANLFSNTVTLISTVTPDITPPDTAIVSAIDGDNSPVSDSGSTVST
jgi:hypothetical protein